MVSEIGLIVGGYVILRCLSFCTRKGDREEHTIVKIMAWLGMFATGFIMIDLLMRGVTTKTPGLP